MEAECLRDSSILGMLLVYAQWDYVSRGKILKLSSPNPLTSVPNGTTLGAMVVNNKTAPEVALTTAGAWTRPTEAVRAAKLIMAPVRAFRKGARHAMRHL